VRDQLLLFMDLLQSELERAVIPDPSNEIARSTAVLAAKQLRRLLVEEQDVPELRKAALTSYGALLPALREAVGGCACDRLHALVTADAPPDWGQLDEVLHELTAALLEKDHEAPRRLAGQLAAVDAGLRDAKEKIWIERSKPTSSRSRSKAPAGGSDEEQARLLDFVKGQFPEESALRIGSIKQIPGGFSKDTLFVDLEDNVGLPDRLVMRRGGRYPGTSVATEYPILQKMHAAGVAVPAPYAIDATGEVYGRPFILLARAPGTVIGDFVDVREPSRAVALDLARKMARLHGAPFDGIEDSLVGGRATITERMRAELEATEATWETVVNQRSFVVRAALDWLKRNVQLAEGPRAVVHRDIGVHNLLVHDEQVSAFLDWETAAIGTPAEDVGYAYYTAVQMADWTEFLAAYEAAAGITLDPRQLDFYMLWASVRIVVPISKGVDPVFSGTTKSLSEYYLGDHIVPVLVQRIAAKLSDVLS
jgi:aminoglycoside phosphotransferase (APT) family kinase protein